MGEGEAIASRLEASTSSQTQTIAGFQWLDVAVLTQARSFESTAKDALPLRPQACGRAFATRTRRAEEQGRWGRRT